MKRFVVKTLVFSLLLMTLVGCVPKNKNVVVTSYPVEYLINTLAKDRVNVQRLDVGSNPQTSTVREDFADVLKNADTLFYINEMQPYWDLYRAEIIEGRNNIEMFDLSERSSLYTFNRFTPVTVDGSTHVVETPYYDTANFKNVDQYDKDPFLWMDPLAMTSMARSIKDWLVKSYPDDKAKFEDRFTKLEMELTYLQADFIKLRSNNGNIKFVAMSPTYGNWQKSFNVGVYPVSISKYGVLPNDAMLTDIRTRIQQDGVRYIAREDGMSAEQELLFNQLKVELDLTEVSLSNLYTLSENDITEQYDYVIKMYKNLETLEAMNQ